MRINCIECKTSGVNPLRSGGRVLKKVFMNGMIRECMTSMIGSIPIVKETPQLNCSGLSQDELMKNKRDDKRKDSLVVKSFAPAMVES
jgi:hypothetical protein